MLIRQLLANVRRIEIRTRKKVDHLTAGAYGSVFKGRGIEFSEVREYAAGDDVRAIDWNVTARLAHPYVKQYIEERELSVMLMVDISASGDFGSGDQAKNELAAELAALLAFSAVRNNDRVGLLLFTSETELYLPPRSGRHHVMRIIRELLATERQSRHTDIGSALQRMMRVMPRRSVVFLISDLLDSGYEKTLSVAARRHDLIAVRLTDPRELQLPPLAYLAAEDAETGEIAWGNFLSPKTRERYSQEAARLRKRTENECRRSGVDLIDIVVGRDVVLPLMKFFRARRKRR